MNFFKGWFARALLGGVAITLSSTLAWTDVQALAPTLAGAEGGEGSTSFTSPPTTVAPPDTSTWVNGNPANYRPNPTSPPTTIPALRPLEPSGLVNRRHAD